MKLEKSPCKVADQDLLGDLKSALEHIGRADVKLLLEQFFDSTKDGGNTNFHSINNFYWDPSHQDFSSKFSVSKSEFSGHQTPNQRESEDNTVVQRPTPDDSQSHSPNFGVGVKAQYDLFNLAELVFELVLRNTICYVGLILGEGPAGQLKDDTYVKDFYQTLKIIIDIVKTTNLSEQDGGQKMQCIIQTTSMFMSELRVFTNKFV